MGPWKAPSLPTARPTLPLNPRFEGLDMHGTAHLDATITRPATGLGTLPSPTEVDFQGLAPWSVVTTRHLVASLRIDRGLFATWRCRGIGPAELPSAWFRPASGGPRYYLISDALAWLAARRGEGFAVRDHWLAYLDTTLGPDCATREWVLKLAENAGPVQGDVRFTSRGWREYLNALSRVQPQTLAEAAS